MPFCIGQIHTDNWGGSQVCLSVVNNDKQGWDLAFFIVRVALSTEWSPGSKGRTEMVDLSSKEDKVIGRMM